MTMMIWSETFGIILLSLTLVHLLLLIERLKICQCGIFSSKFVRLPTAILISTLLAQSLLEIHLLTVHRILCLGEKALQGQVGVLTRTVALDVVRVVALRKGVAAVAVVVLRVVDLRGEVARHAVVVVRRVGVVLVVDEVLRRRVLLPDRLRSNRTPRPSAKSVVFRTHSP